jgi:glucose/arabinose dehydrogenase
VRHAPIISLVVVAGFFAACSSEQTPADGSSSSSSGGAASSSGGSSGDTTSGSSSGTPGKVYPAAKGDPCRGIELPADQHYVPAGMCARLVATNIANIRQITFAPNGDLWAATNSGNIYRMRDGDDDGFIAATEIVNYAKTGGNGNNVHLDVAGGFIYAGSPNGVVRFPYSDSEPSGGTPQNVVVNQPSNGHATHTVHLYDGYLYVQSGSSNNASVDGDATPYDTERSLIKRFPMASFNAASPFDWNTGGEIVSAGLRNTNGFTRNANGKIFGVVNGLDGQVYKGVDVHNDNPGEQVIEIAAGKNYGYPFCFTAQAVETGGTIVTPGTQLVNASLQSGVPKDDAWCAQNSQPPATFIQAHSAPLDISFFDEHPAGNLPEKYRGGAFVALHGSWNRDPNTGYKVIWIPFDASGKPPMPTTAKVTKDGKQVLETTFPYETIFGGGNASGAKDGSWAWTADTYSDGEVRPAGVAVGPLDGALYIAADKGGKIYRVGVKK